MRKLKIKYKKKYFTQKLIFAIIWTLFGVFSLSYKDENNWTDYGYLVLAILYWSYYFYEITNQYLAIDNDWIKVNSPFGRKIKMSEIEEVKKFAGDYILKTDKCELTINTQIMEKESLGALNGILAQLDLPPEKTPFSNKDV